MLHKAAHCQAQDLATGQANMHSTLQPFRCALPLMPYGYCHHRGVHSDCFQVCCPSCIHWQTRDAFPLSPSLTAPHRLWCKDCMHPLLLVMKQASHHVPGQQHCLPLGAGLFQLLCSLLVARALWAIWAGWAGPALVTGRLPLVDLPDNLGGVRGQPLPGAEGLLQPDMRVTADLLTQS